jgi:hypothetical protein
MMHFLSPDHPVMTAPPLHLSATHVHGNDCVRPLLSALHRALTTPGRLGAHGCHACMGHRMPHHCAPGPTGAASTGEEEWVSLCSAGTQGV